MKYTALYELHLTSRQVGRLILTLLILRFRKSFMLQLILLEHLVKSVNLMTRAQLFKANDVVS